MKMNDQEHVRDALIKAIQKAMDDIAEQPNDLPYMGDGTIYLMADAALIVLRALDDTETYLRDATLLKDE